MSPFPLFYDREPVDGSEALIARFGDKDFESPERSTLPLLALLHEAPLVFAGLLKMLGAPAGSQLHFEYTVDSPRGRGLPSHTDLMVRSPPLQLALEIKWGEPRYETVAHWFGKDPEPPNKAERLQGWLDLLRRQAPRIRHAADFSGAVYQMVHRAASACAAAPGVTVHPRLAYVLFTPQPNGQSADREQYASDLLHLHKLIGRPAGFGFSLVEIYVTPTSLYRSIQGLRKGAPETVAAVREALLKGGLFRFEGMTQGSIE